MHGRSTVSSPHIPWPCQGTLVTCEIPRRCFYQNRLLVGGGESLKFFLKEYIYWLSRGPSSCPLLLRPRGLSENCFPVIYPLNVTAVFFFLPLCLLWSLTHWTQLKGCFALALTPRFSLLVLTGSGERKVGVPLQMFWSSAFSPPIHVVTVVRGSSGPM